MNKIKTYEREDRVCTLCFHKIIDGLCSYDCPQDANFSRERVLIRKYKVTEELISERIEKKNDKR